MCLFVYLFMMFLRWGEVGLLLRKPIKCEEDMFYTVAAAEAGIIFADQVNTWYCNI